MARILHTADWQLGASEMPPIYHEQAIPKLIEFARENSVEYILCVGDIFDKPNPTPQVKDRLLSLLAKNKDLFFIFVVGNHDYTTKSLQYHNLNYLDIIEKEVCDGEDTNFRVIQPGKIYEFSSFSIYNLLDWKVPENLEYTKKDPLIFAWHGTIPSMKFGSKGIEKGESEKQAKEILKSTKGATYIALGDLHRTIKITDSCYYPGPPVQKTYGDSDGFLIVDIEKGQCKVTEHHLDLPKKINVELTFDDGKDSEESIVKCVKKEVKKGQLVKLKFAMPLKIWASLNKENIQHGLKDHCLEVKFQNDPILDQQTRESMEEISKAKTLEEELEILVADDSYGLDGKLLLEYCKKFLH